MTKNNLNVTGMHCKSCSLLITGVLEDLGASDISVKLDEKTQIGKVSFEYSGNQKKVIEEIEKEGYKVSK